MEEREEVSDDKTTKSDSGPNLVLDELFSSVHDVEKSLLVDGGHVTRLEPQIGSEAVLGRLLVIEVALERFSENVLGGGKSGFPTFMMLGPLTHSSPGSPRGTSMTFPSSCSSTNLAWILGSNQPTLPTLALCSAVRQWVMGDVSVNP
jgi:hypothetical protein